MKQATKEDLTKAKIQGYFETISEDGEQLKFTFNHNEFYRFVINIATACYDDFLDSRFLQIASRYKTEAIDFIEKNKCNLPDAESNYWYAKNVIKSRFTKGEDAVATDTFIKNLYEEEFNVNL